MGVASLTIPTKGFTKEEIILKTQQKKEMSFFEPCISKRGTLYLVINKEGDNERPKGINYVVLNMFTGDVHKHARNKLLCIKSNDIDFDWWKMIIDSAKFINPIDGGKLFSGYAGLSVKNQYIQMHLMQ